MIIHRLETQAPPEPPVRFYKIIALSFLAITVILLGVVIFVTSKKAAITVVAKEDPRIVQISAQVVASPQNKGEVRGMVSTTQFAWSQKFFPTGNKTVEGVATGEVTLYNKTDADQTLVKTTRLLTLSGVLFRLNDRVTVPAQGSIKASVYADQPGSASEIGASQFTIPGLSLDKQKVIYAESTANMVGGKRTIGILSDTDVKAALAKYKESVKEEFLKQTAAAVPSGFERVVTVVGESAETDREVGEEVSEFNIMGTSTIAVVSYDADALAEYVDTVAADKIDTAAERLMTINSKPTVEVVNTDSKNNTAELSVDQSITVTLDADVESLDSKHFLGKKKDEIERYVMSLDHVAGVEVKFSPSWMLSAPTVPDKIKVVVKNMK